MKDDGEPAIRACLLPYQEDLIARRYWGNKKSGELPTPFKGFVQKAMVYTNESGQCIGITIQVHGTPPLQKGGGIDITESIISYLDNPKEKYDDLITTLAWKVKRRSGNL